MSGVAARSADKEKNTMNMTWKYKIDMKNLQAFADVEKFRGILIPEELKNFVAEHNAATPSRHHFMVGATERVFGAVLSFEKMRPRQIPCIQLWKLWRTKTCFRLQSIPLAIISAIS